MTLVSKNDYKVYENMFKSKPLLQELRIQKFLNFSEQNVSTDQIQLEECEIPSSIVERIKSPPLMIIPTPIHSGIYLNSNFIIEHREFEKLQLTKF